MTDHNQAAKHYQRLVESCLGREILQYLNDPELIEIMLNPDGVVVIETIDKGKQLTEIRIEREQAFNVIKLVASFQGGTVSRENPAVAGVLPGIGYRFQGWLPPVSGNPVFAIRKQSKTELTLDLYVQSRCMTVDQCRFLRRAISLRRNIIIAGGTSSGKSTLAAALLKELEHTNERVLILEDLPELIVNIPDQVTLRTNDSTTMRDLVHGSLRMRPDRIIIGEVRDGAALDLLKAWNTGHPGGITTIHANSAESVISRLGDLICEVVSQIPTNVIFEAVDIIVELDSTKSQRGLVTKILEVSSEDGQLMPALHLPKVV